MRHEERSGQRRLPIFNLSKILYARTFFPACFPHPDPSPPQSILAQWQRRWQDLYDSHHCFNATKQSSPTSTRYDQTNHVHKTDKDDTPAVQKPRTFFCRHVLHALFSHLDSARSQTGALHRPSLAIDREKQKVSDDSNLLWKAHAIVAKWRKAKMREGIGPLSVLP